MTNSQSKVAPDWFLVDPTNESIALVPVRNRAGVYSIVDMCFVDKIGDHCKIWNDSGRGYLRGHDVVTNKPVYLHQLVKYIYHNVWSTRAMQVHHKDHNRLNNLLENLRFVTHGENQRDRLVKTYNGKLCSSKFPGVSYDKKSGKWTASICVDYKTKQLGVYTSEKDAAMVYRKAALEIDPDLDFASWGDLDEKDPRKTVVVYAESGSTVNIN